MVVCCWSGWCWGSWYNCEWWTDHTQPMDDSWWCCDQYLSA